MSRELFGTDGVRAIAGEYPLDDTGLVAIGRAVGTQFATENQTIVIACDTRESSRHLVDKLSEGLQAVGVHVVFIGVIPTPGLAYITRTHDDFVAGIMVTASHNTFEYNGVKVFSKDGGKLPDEAEAKLNEAIEAGVPNRGELGKFTENTYLLSEYEHFLVGSAKGANFTGLKIAIDTANGAASGVAARVFERLGAEVISLADAPDGKNINVACGATDTSALQKLVVESQCILGIAVDGDADRLMMVDSQGRECNGDTLLYLLAVSNHYDHVVATVMTNLGAEQAMQKAGIELDRTAVGDRYVLERLLETGYKIGGEQSGHIILPDISTTGDGLLSAVQVLCVVQSSDTSLDEWRDMVPMLPQALVNFRIEDKHKLSSPEVVAYVQKETVALGDAGRILVRPSGTEPLARVMVEAPDAQQLAASIAAKLQELVS